MNDLGVSLHSYNGVENFKRAVEAAGTPVFDERYWEAGFSPSKLDSPVLGVERTIPRFSSEELREYAGRTDIAFEGSLEEYAQVAVGRLLEHIREHWDASRPTLISHSSGYDSRILSSCLAQLRDDGFELGEVHFRCR